MISIFKYETKFGTLTLRNVVIPGPAKTLIDGVEIKDEDGNVFEVDGCSAGDFEDNINFLERIYENEVENNEL